MCEKLKFPEILYVDIYISSEEGWENKPGYPIGERLKKSGSMYSMGNYITIKHDVD